MLSLVSRLFFAVTALVVLTSCTTMISEEMLPGLEYRENPVVEIIEYGDRAKLQEDCMRQHRRTDLNYSGCALVPLDPAEKCIIRVMAGDERTRKHELAHCHGHADTWLPWKADNDFYRRSGRK